MTIKNIAIGIFLGLLGAAAGFYAEHQAATIRAEALAERQAQQAAIEGTKDLTATAIADCGRIQFIQFIKRNGAREIVQMPDQAHIGGLIARLKRIDPTRVNSLVNTRSCHQDLTT